MFTCKRYVKNYYYYYYYERVLFIKGRFNTADDRGTTRRSGQIPKIDY